MRLASFLVLCLVVFPLFSPPHLSAQQAPAPKFATEVPLLDCDGLPCVEAHLGSGPALKLAIDTGNVDSVLDTSLAESIGLKSTAPLPAGAPAGMYRTEIPAITVGAVQLTKLRALAMGLGQMISEHQMPKADGTLSYTAFKDRVLQLDFVNHKLRISGVLAAPASCTGTCDKLSLIKFGNSGPPIVVAGGFEINDTKLTAQVDTMFSGTLLVYTPSIQKLQLAAAAKTDKARDFPFTDGGVSMKEAVAPAEAFHGITLSGSAPLVYFPTPGVHEPDGLFDATVGVELFYKSILTLDFRGMTISVEKP